MKNINFYSLCLLLSFPFFVQASFSDLASDEIFQQEKISREELEQQLKEEALEDEARLDTTEVITGNISYQELIVNNDGVSTSTSATLDLTGDATLDSLRVDVLNQLEQNNLLSNKNLSILKDKKFWTSNFMTDEKKKLIQQYYRKIIKTLFELFIQLLEQTADYIDQKLSELALLQKTVKLIEDAYDAWKEKKPTDQNTSDNTSSSTEDEQRRRQEEQELEEEERKAREEEERKAQEEKEKHEQEEREAAEHERAAEHPEGYGF